MLNRLVVYLGATQEEADQMLAESQPQVDRAHMVRRDDGETLLALDEDFSRAWRRTGLALDRVGFHRGGPGPVSGPLLRALCGPAKGRARRRKGLAGLSSNSGSPMKSRRRPMTTRLSDQSHR